LVFSATSHGSKYELDMELFEEIVKDESKWNTKGRSILVCLSKKDKN
jgi:hypothetical protein